MLSWGLTLFILMDFPIHIDTVSMELSVLYFNPLLYNKYHIFENIMVNGAFAL